MNDVDEIIASLLAGAVVAIAIPNLLKSRQ